MRLTMALDMLHRKIEEWAEEAFIEPDVSDIAIEGFVEFGSDMVAYLHELAEQFEMSDEEVMLPEMEAEGAELCDEIATLFVDEWALRDFAERPAGVDIEGLRELMETVADVLSAPPDDCEMELETAIEELDEFLVV